MNRHFPAVHCNTKNDVKHHYEQFITFSFFDLYFKNTISEQAVFVHLKERVGFVGFEFKKFYYKGKIIANHLQFSSLIKNLALVCVGGDAASLYWHIFKQIIFSFSVIVINDFHIDYFHRHRQRNRSCCETMVLPFDLQQVATRNVL